LPKSSQKFAFSWYCKEPNLFIGKKHYRRDKKRIWFITEIVLKVENCQHKGFRGNFYGPRFPSNWHFMLYFFFCKDASAI
jgi:hypothetical protein